MGQTKVQRIVKQLAGSVQKQTAIATDMFIPNHSGDNSAGMVLKTPVNDTDFVNKKYVDGQNLWEYNGSETQLKIANEINLRSKKIINLLDPTANQDASTLKYCKTNPTNLLNNQIAYSNGNNLLGSDNFKWDYTNGRLHIRNGTSSGLPTIHAGTSFLLQSNTDSWSNVRFSFMSGTIGEVIWDLGDTARIDSGGLKYNNWYNYMGLRTNTAYRLYIDQDGDIGVGFAAPTTPYATGRFNVKGTTNNGTTIIYNGFDSDAVSVFYVDTNGKVTGDGGGHFGDATNYTEIKADGEINLHGTARVTKCITIRVGGFKAPGVSPADFEALGIAGCYAFASTTDQYISTEITIPVDMDISIAPTLIADWSATATTGTAVWRLEYLYRAVGEDVTAVAQETLTGESDPSGTSNGLVRAEMTGIDLPSATDRIMLVRISRDTTDEVYTDDMEGDAHLTAIKICYTSNKLGEAT